MRFWSTSTILEAKLQDIFIRMRVLGKPKIFLQRAEQSIGNLLPFKGHKIESDGKIYMVRYFLTQPGQWPQVWLHKILISDPDPWLHDHPWDYASLMLEGGYSEITNSQGLRVNEGAAIYRKAESSHRLELQKEAITLFVAAKKRRQWGFHTDKGWIESSQYLRMAN